MLQKAKKKKMDKIKLSDLGVELQEHQTVVSVEEPPQRSAGIKVEDVDSLIGALKEAGRIWEAYGKSSLKNIFRLLQEWHKFIIFQRELLKV